MCSLCTYLRPIGKLISSRAKLMSTAQAGCLTFDLYIYNQLYAMQCRIYFDSCSCNSRPSDSMYESSSERRYELVISISVLPHDVLQFTTPRSHLAAGSFQTRSCMSRERLELKFELTPEGRCRFLCRLGARTYLPHQRSQAAKLGSTRSATQGGGRGGGADNKGPFEEA